MTDNPERLVRMKADTFRARLRLGMDMPNAIHVPEALKLRDDAVASLCHTLCVDGDLDLSGCTTLEILPERLVVRGKLILDDCAQITGLPATVREVFGLSALDCAKLRSISSVAHCRGSLNLTGCTSLEPLAPAFRAVGRVELGQYAFGRDLVRVRASLPDAMIVAVAGRRLGDVIDVPMLARHAVLNAVVESASNDPCWEGSALFVDTSALVIPKPDRTA